MLIFHGTPEGVAEQIQGFAAESGTTYLMVAPMSGRSFRLLADKVLPRIAGRIRNRRDIARVREFSHAAGAVLQLVVFIALVLAELVGRPPSRTG